MMEDETGSLYSGEYVDHTDLGAKMTSVVRFTSKCPPGEKFFDRFLIFTRNVPDRAQKNVVLNWYSKHFMPGVKVSYEDRDTRNHEDMLCDHFQEYSLVIEKLPYYWSVVISTPDDGHRALKRVLREAEKKN